MSGPPRRNGTPYLPSLKRNRRSRAPKPAPARRAARRGPKPANRIGELHCQFVAPTKNGSGAGSAPTQKCDRTVEPAAVPPEMELEERAPEPSELCQPADEGPADSKSRKSWAAAKRVTAAQRLWTETTGAGDYTGRFYSGLNSAFSSNLISVRARHSTQSAVQSGE